MQNAEINRQRKSLQKNYILQYAERNLNTKSLGIVCELKPRKRLYRWVGFGLGEPGSGSMPGSDFVVGWVDNEGSVHAEDRHAAPTLGPAPLLDDCQRYV